MAVKFQTKIKSVRFKGIGYNGEQMAEVGGSLVASIKARLAQAKDSRDQPAPPLSRDYGRAKGRRTGQAIRNWRLTGLTVASMNVLTAASNRFRVGFVSPVANKRAYFNNLRYRQFGVSPRDRQNIIAAFMKLGSPVKAIPMPSQTEDKAA